MANTHCEGEHIWGPIFDSGNVYCRHCGDLLGNVNEEGKVPGVIMVEKPLSNRLLTGITYDDGKGDGPKPVVMDPNAPPTEITFTGDLYPNGFYPD